MGFDIGMLLAIVIGLRLIALFFVMLRARHVR